MKTVVDMSENIFHVTYYTSLKQSSDLCYIFSSGSSFQNVRQLSSANLAFLIRVLNEVCMLYNIHNYVHNYQSHLFSAQLLKLTFRWLYNWEVLSFVHVCINQY